MHKILKSQKRVKKYNANRFTACLLAVLMLFSALSTGSITVHAETPGAVVKIGDNEYTSLADAITAAGTSATSENAVVIALLDDIKLDKDVKIGNYITLNLNDKTLDLNGKTLDLNGCTLSIGSSGKVVDNSDGKTGLLKADSGKCYSLNNTQVPVYNTEKNGYVVADITHQEHVVETTDTDAFEFIFKPYFGETIKGLLTSGGEDAEVSIRILVAWTDANGKPKTQFLDYTPAMVQEVYANNSGKAFYLKVTDFDNFANLKITPLIQSELGTECRGTTYTLTEATVAVESVSLDPSTLELVVGSTATLTATIAPDNATNKTVTWTSSATDVATVDANGLVTGVKAGTATITATTSNGKTAECTVEVKVYTEYGSYKFDFDDMTSGSITSGTKLSPGKNSKLQAGASACISAVNVAEDDNDADIAIELKSNAYSYGNALCQIDLATSSSDTAYQSYNKVKISYSINVEDILSIADSSAFPLIKSSDSVSASPIKLTATTTDATTGEKTGKIQYLTSEGYQDVQEYSTEDWYDFSFVLNFTSQTYDLYINNQKMLNGVQLVTADGNRMSNIRYIVFQINSAGNQTSSILLDDLSVWVPATN